MGQSLPAALDQCTSALPLAVAYSGGADSTALLLACVQKWPGQVGAIHIHHGLQAAADEFQRHCETVCARLQVPLVVRRVQAHPEAGQSPEAAARYARYNAFTSVAAEDWPAFAQRPASDSRAGATPQRKIQSILLAQHADDQVETLLLALSRGAGVAGLAAMPRAWVRQNVSYQRPLLGVAASEIRRWLATQSESFIEDPTNSDLRYTRNQIRARLLPVLQQTFPQFRETFARTARHAAQANEILTELGRQDLALIGRLADQTPTIALLQTLSQARQSNVLRFWLKSSAQVIPSAAQLDELISQVAACVTRGHHIRIKIGLGFVVREAEVLAWYNP